jgi:hypothetical protein
LSGVLGDWPAERRAQLLQESRHLLRDGGLLIVSETLLHADRSGPLAAAMLALVMLVATGGNNFTPDEIVQMIAQAGFRDIKVVSNQDLGVRDLLVARR